MMGFLSGLFGGTETASKAMDIAGDSIRGIGTWIDEKDYTPEEKAIANAKMVDAHLELIKATSDENSIRSISRRYIAWGVMAFVMLWGSVAMTAALMGRLEIVNNIINVMVAIRMDWAFSAVIVFYFGAHLVGALKK